MSLIEPDEGEAFVVHNLGAAAPFVFIVDHAGRAVPRALNRLGLPPEAFERHIAWDIGALDLGRALAARFDAALLAQRWSRLVIDCNRDPDRADAIPEVSDGTPIPGNIGLTPQARAARVAEVHAPYQDAIGAELAARDARGLRTVLVLVHSFTPRMAGFDRPWRYGVLHGPPSRASAAALAAFARQPEWVVGDNEPYRMDEVDHTAPRHGLLPGRDYLELEIRQDLIADAAGVAQVAAELEPVLREVSSELRLS